MIKYQRFKEVLIMEMYLRHIELDDLKEVEIMLKEFWKTQLYDATKADILEDIRRLLSPKCFSFLIISQNKIAGFIYVNEKYGYTNNIEYLYIKPEFRGNGLGSFALTKIKEIILAHGEDRVQIEVNPSNFKAMKLYHSLGFDNIDSLTLSTGIIGKTETKRIFDLDFKINEVNAFAHKKKDI